jgi:hypothetical protein
MVMPFVASSGDWRRNAAPAQEVPQRVVATKHQKAGGFHDRSKAI